MSKGTISGSRRSSRDDSDQASQTRPHDVEEDAEKDEPEWWLDCETDQPRPLVQLLTLLLHSPSRSIGSDPTMTLFCGPTGLTIHNAPNPQFQSTLELPIALFRRYHVADSEDYGEHVSSFSVSSKSLLECLQVLCLVEPPEQLDFKYHGPSQLLRLEARFPKGGISSAAILGKIPPTESAELSTAFGACEVVGRLLCASSHLQDTAELDLVQGASAVSVQLASVPEPALILSVVGHSSHCEVVLPGPVELTVGNNPGTFIRREYPIDAWRRAIKAIELAKETCLSINAQGILAIQHQILVGGQQEAAFCDSLLLPLVMQDDDGHTETSSSRTAVFGVERHSDTDHGTIDEESRASRYSYPLHSQPAHSSTHQAEDASTIATAPTPAFFPDEGSGTDSDTDASSMAGSSALSRPPLTFGSNTIKVSATSATAAVNATAAPAGSFTRSQRRRQSYQRRHQMEQESKLSASLSSGEPSYQSKSLSGVELSNRKPGESPNAKRDRKRGRRRALSSQDSSESSSSSSSSSPSPPSPRAQPEYCSSPEVVYGDTS